MTKVKLLLPILMAAAVVATGLPAFAHHSAGSTYDMSHEIKLKGKIVQISIRTPHSFFFVEAPDEKGAVQRWAIEGAAAGQFARQGIDQDSFKVGDPVEIVARPARSPDSPRGLLVRIVRTTDGKSWGT